MEKILITGASGFPGSNITQLLKNNYKVVGGYNRYDIPLDNKVKINLLNISAINSVLNNISPDIVIHTAALSSPGICEEYPEKSEIINVRATGKIAEWCQNNNARLIFTSTDSVYSDNNQINSEEDILKPVNKYGETKKAAEEAIKKNCDNYVILRLALLYGKGAYKREYRSEWLERKLRILQAGKADGQVGLYTDQYRNMISVKNVAKVIRKLITMEGDIVINIGGPEFISRYDFGKMLCKQLNISRKYIKPVQYKNFITKVKSPYKIPLNLKKAESLGLKLLSIKEGLELEYS